MKGNGRYLGGKKSQNGAQQSHKGSFKGGTIVIVVSNPENEG